MAFPLAWILAHSIPEHVDAETFIAVQSYFSKGTRTSPDTEAKASTFSFTLCSQVLHIALCLICVCTQSFMQYLCKAISAPSELLCTVQCRHCFQNKIQLNKICLNGTFFFLFCHFSSGRFQSDSSLPGHLFHSEYKLLSPGLSSDISVFILHSVPVPGRKRNTGTARTVNSLHHMERRMQH